MFLSERQYWSSTVEAESDCGQSTWHSKSVGGGGGGAGASPGEYGGVEGGVGGGDGGGSGGGGSKSCVPQ